MILLVGGLKVWTNIKCTKDTLYIIHLLFSVLGKYILYNNIVYNILYIYTRSLLNMTFFQMVFWCLTVLSICRIDLFRQRRSYRNFYTHLKILHKRKLWSLFTRHIGRVFLFIIVKLVSYYILLFLQLQKAF